MFTCENCGTDATIDGGICTEETGRLCQVCADSTNWEQYVDSEYIGTDNSGTRIYE